MKTAAVICEYNPFHNGHLYQLKEIRRILGADTRVICLMSGDFVQRGEAAVSDKWHRAAAAARGGADLVLELPFCYACNGAGEFAAGAVRILDSLGTVDYLCFGSESGSLAELERCAEEDSGRIRELLDEGMSYPRATREARGAGSDILSSPNNTLAAEYLRALKKLGSRIEPLTIKRMGDISSSSIRSARARGEDVSDRVPESGDWFTGTIPYALVASRVFAMSGGEIDSLPSAGEGIGIKIKKDIRRWSDLSSLVDGVRRSRYTRARINRVICQILVGYERSDAVRILAVGRDGSSVIRELDERGVGYITNINRQAGVSQKDITASDMYNLITGRDLYENSDYIKRPYILESDEKSV